MGEILMAMFPGMEFPEPKLTDLEPMKRSVRFMKEAVTIPVVVKLSGTFSHITKEWAIGVEEAGADGISCSDALGPALSIDIGTGEPALGGPRGVGGLTGPAIMPITLRMVLEAAMYTSLPVIGVGGVTGPEDVVQYIMAGATLVGVCTAGHKNGLEKYTKIIEGFNKLTEELGYSNLDSIRGLTLKRIEERKEAGKQAVTEPVVPIVVEDWCTACGNCMAACAYDAIEVDEYAVIRKENCIGCGLCVSVCPTNAITQKYY
jgi:ferredoxin